MKKGFCRVIAIICFLLPVTSTAVFASETIPVPGSNLATDLSLGSTGDDVLAVQQRLTALGYNPGPSDGIYGYETQIAVMLFQSVNGLYVDGIVGSATRNTLFHSASGQPLFPEDPVQPVDPADPVQLSLGSSGENVLAIQLQLLALGYNPGEPDGYFGPVTEAAVKEFQAANGLYVDGIAGSITNNALYSSSAVAKTDASWKSIYEGIIADENVAEPAENSTSFTFHQDGWYIARLAVKVWDKEKQDYKWIYSVSRAKGQKTTVSIDPDKYKIHQVGYQIWILGWNNDYMYMPWAKTDYATDFTLSGFGDDPVFSWK